MEQGLYYYQSLRFDSAEVYFLKAKNHLEPDNNPELFCTAINYSTFLFCQEKIIECGRVCFKNLKECC